MTEKLPPWGAPGYRWYRVAQGNRCYLCGDPLGPPDSQPWHTVLATLDHIKPKAHSGTRAPPNVALAHAKCNGKKGSRKPRACEVLYGEVLADMSGLKFDKWRENQKLGLPNKPRWTDPNPDFESALAIALREAGYK